MLKYRSPFPFLQFFVLTILLMLSSVSLASAAPLSPEVHRNVLLINSYHKGYKWSDDITAAIVEGLRRYDPQLHLYIEHLDSKRIPVRDHWSLLHEAMVAKYANRKFSLILTSDNNAFDFVLRFRNRFDPDVPIVFCGLNHFRPDSLKDEKKITGVAEDVNLEQTIKVALAVSKGVRKLVFIGGDSRSSKLNFERLAAYLPQLEKRYQVERIGGKNLTELEGVVSRLSSESIVFIIGFPKDKGERRVSVQEIGARLSSASTVPVYSLWDFFIGTGVTGGSVLNGTDQGKKAAELGTAILEGTPADSIPVVMKSPLSTIFDYTQVQRYNIDTDRLPADTIYINKPFSFYRTYKKRVYAVCVAFFVLSTLIVLLLRNIGRRKEAEEQLHAANVHLEERVRERTRELQDLSSLNRHIVSDSSQGIVVYDESGQCISANEAAAAILGGTVEQLLQLNYGELQSWNENGLQEKAAEAMQTGKVVTGQIYGESPFGKEVWMKNTFSSFIKQDRKYLMVLVEDITDREKAYRELEKWEHIFKLCRWGIAIGNPEDNTLVTVNPGLAEMHGWTVEELTGRPIAVLFDPAAGEELKGHIKTVNEIGHHTFELSHIRKDGTIFPAIVDVVAVKDEDRRVLYRVATIIDISERKNLEQEREKLIVELQAALAEVRTLSSFLPICASCKKIRDDQGYWSQIEEYIHSRTGTQFSHGICPECMERYYPQLKK